MLTFLKDFYHDRTFLAMLIKISLPIVLQNLISSSLSMVDTVMIGMLGAKELAAVGVATQFFFFFTVLLVGISSGFCIYIAQYWGKRDSKSIKKYLGVMLTYSLALGVVFMLVGLFLPEWFMGLFNKDQQVIHLGSVYIRVLAVSTILTALTYAYGFASRSIENAFLPMLASSAALLMNTILNYMMIFGHGGFPAMGVAGAAWATLIARVAESAIIIGYIYYNKNILAIKPKDLDLSGSFLGKDLKTIFPVLLNELCWGLGVVVYTMAYGRLGTNALASIQIGQTVQNLFIVVGFGISGAAAAMIGAKIGEGKTHLAKVYAQRCIFLGTTIGLILSVVIFFFAPLFLLLFNVEEVVTHDAILILKVLSLTITLKLLNMILIMGVLRGGGDVLYSLFAEACTMWCIGVPLAFIGALYLHLPVYLVFALIAIEEVVKFLLGVYRMISNKWVHNLVE